MSFSWMEYLDLAQELAGQSRTPSTQEAKLRSAISRAYYAAFCRARNHLRDREGQAIPLGGDAHKYVWNQFKNSPDRKRRKVGENGDRLREDCRKADYDDTIINLPALATKALTRSVQVISLA